MIRISNIYFNSSLKTIFEEAKTKQNKKNSGKKITNSRHIKLNTKQLHKTKNQDLLTQSHNKNARF